MRSVLALTGFVLGLVAVSANAGPDLITSSIGVWFPEGTGVQRLGSEGGVSAYSVTSFSCNVGDANLPWNGFTADHPIFNQNLYRLHEDRFEMIGMAWAKHVVATVPQDLFCGTCNWPGSFELGVGCSDPYDAPTNANQVRLGPRSEINPVTGTFPFPFTGMDEEGPLLYKRMQVSNADLDPVNYPGARFFFEGQYVSASDIVAGNELNNSGYIEVALDTFNNGGWDLVRVGEPTAEQAAIFAWQEANPAVSIDTIDISGDGRFFVASLVTDLGGGTWRYEYFLFNYNSHRCASGFSIPTGSGVNITNQGFHDIDQHSGETVSSLDWSGASGGGSVSWSTDTFDVDPLANALRFSSGYNFRFDANSPPESGVATIELFRSGNPPSVLASVSVPQSLGSPVPAVSTWGVGIVLLSLLTVGQLVFSGWKRSFGTSRSLS